MFATLRHHVMLSRSLVQSDSWVIVPKTAVLVDGRLSESFEVTPGVLKGSMLAPFLSLSSKGDNSGLLTYRRGQPAIKHSS